MEQNKQCPTINNFKLWLSFLVGMCCMIIGAAIFDWTSRGPGALFQRKVGDEEQAMYGAGSGQISLSSLNNLTPDRQKEKSHLGIEVQTISEPVAKQLNLTSEGVLVNKVIDGSPAEKDGLKRGDVIVRFNRKVVKDISGFQELISKTSPGERIKIEVIRDGKHKSLYVKMGSINSSLISRTALEGKTGQERNGWGITIAPLSQELGYRVGISDKEEGVAVVRVTGGSRAERAGLKEGDLIRSVNRKATPDLNSFFAVLNKDPDKVGAVLDISRQGQDLYVVIEPANQINYTLIGGGSEDSDDEGGYKGKPSTIPPMGKPGENTQINFFLTDEQNDTLNEHADKPQCKRLDPEKYFQD